MIFLSDFEFQIFFRISFQIFYNYRKLSNFATFLKNFDVFCTFSIVDKNQIFTYGTFENFASLKEKNKKKKK